MGKTIISIVILLLVGGLCFMLGRLTSSNEVTTTTTWVAKPPVVLALDSSELKPFRESPGHSNKMVTIYKDEPVKVSNSSPIDSTHLIDTAKSMQATVNDWNVKREYSNVMLKNDTTGTISYNATVQYNKLQDMQVTVSPVQKQISTTIVKTKAIKPFVLGDINTFNQLSIGAGVVIGNSGPYIKYIRDFDNKRDGVSLGGIIYF